MMRHESEIMRRIAGAPAGRLAAIDVCRGLPWGSAFATLEALVGSGRLKRIKRVGNSNPDYAIPVAS
jgi:hypothetical protein